MVDGLSFACRRAVEERASIRRHVDGAVVDRLLAEHAAGRQHVQVVRTLLMLELLLRRWGW